MKKDNHPTNTNFWFGFALGSISLTAVAYLLGTAKGREKLKQLVEYADTMNDLPEEFFALLPTIKDMINKTDTSQGTVQTSDEKHSYTELPKTQSNQENQSSIPQQISTSLESIIERVKHGAEEKKESKKYFVKSDT